MGLQFSDIISAKQASHGTVFSVSRLDLGDAGAPIMGFDHFRMSGRTFAPHPHAGFSAVSYVFEDSPGALRNRDSLGHDRLVQPGELVWTQAGSGIIHDEFPAEDGVTVHGLQLFVNLSSQNKQIPPRMFHAHASEIPVFADDTNNRIRVLVGQLDGQRSPVETAERLDFFDVRARGVRRYQVAGGFTALVYVMSGTATVSGAAEPRPLAAHQAVIIRADAQGGELLVDATPAAHFLLLSGQDPGEPVAIQGPFIMNTREQLLQAYGRYRNGQMGQLAEI